MAFQENKTENKIESDTQKKEKKEKKKIAAKQIFAMAGVVVLVLLYVVTLLAAIFDSSATHGLFAMSLFATIAIPLLLWIYAWMYEKLTGK